MKLKLLLLPFLTFGLMALGLVTYTQLFASSAHAGDDSYGRMHYNRGYRNKSDNEDNRMYKMKGYMNNIPNLPPCPQPGGQQIAGYSDGVHQIPGGNLMQGSDYVYKVGDKLFVQCFCPPNGQYGIQSNWVHESYLNPQQQQFVMSQGWIKITNGADWGLPDGTYFVKNTQFNCNQNCVPGTNNQNNQSSMNVEQENKVSVNQSNTSHVHNDVQVNNNTGDNHVMDNTGGNNGAQTGNSTSVVNVTNTGNSNTANVVVQNGVAYYYN